MWSTIIIILIITDNNSRLTLEMIVEHIAGSPLTQDGLYAGLFLGHLLD